MKGGQKAHVVEFQNTVCLVCLSIAGQCMYVIMCVFYAVTEHFFLLIYY